MEKKMKITEQELSNIVTTAVKKVLSESFHFRRPRPEGNPQKLADVIKADGWRATKTAQDATGFTLLFFRSGESFLGYDEPLSFEDLVEDIKIYLEDKHAPFRAESFYGEGDNGSYIKFIKAGM